MTTETVSETRLHCKALEYNGTMTSYEELRNAADRKVTNEYEKRPRCAVLLSPEKLNESYNSQGQDATNTRRDLNDVCEWARQAGFLNAEFFVDAINVDENQLLEETVYKSLVNFAFGSAVDPIRDTYFLGKDELMLLYYVGHGLEPQSANGQSSSPLLDNYYFKIAENRTSDRTVKGGELCLHDVGFCDLMGLLTPWIAAVNEESSNVPGVKKNKHLVVIADSCYSGVLVQDLQQLAKTPGPWNANGCTVTVQSACGNNEPTVGGYFTPCFVYFNKPENQPSLQKLKDEWDGKSEVEKNAYRADGLPSPQVATTMPSERLISNEENPILVLPVIQGLTLTLFPDAGFFKFCFLSFFGTAGSKVRALTDTGINTFLSQDHFTIVSYKLKIISNGTPIALVLVDDPNDNAHVVCAHIHFNDANTDLGNVSGVNLIHHNWPTNPDCLDDVFPQDISDYKSRFEPPFTTGLVELVKQCKDYVENNGPSGIWADSTRWNMEQSFLNKSRLKERSRWMKDNVEKMTEKNSQAPTLCSGHYIIIIMCIIIICISMVFAYFGYC